VHLGEVIRRQDRTAREEPDAQHDVGLKPRGDPEQRHEESEEQQGKANVVLRAEDRQRAAPGNDDGDKGLGRHDQFGSYPRRGSRQQFAVGGEVRREEEGQQDLGDLDGLEGERTQLDPESGAADLFAHVGYERQEKQEMAAVNVR
jgi:hypothetical protein